MRYPIKVLILISLFGFFQHTAKAQIWLSNEDIYDEAEEYLNAEEYVEALPLYLLLEKKELLNANISYKIGSCYLNIRGKKDKSLPYLESAAQHATSGFNESFSESRAPLKALLLLGVAYRIDNRPAKAIEVFKQLKDSIVEKDPEFATVIDMHIKRCENAILLNAFPGEPRSEKLPIQINDEFSNYNPVLVGHDSLLFYMEELKFYDALMRVVNTDGNWGTPENITPAIGSDGDHIIVGSSADGKTLLLYMYEPLKAGEIYVTHATETGWSELKPLNKNINTLYHETHASLSYDGKTLYFTSNRPGGYGGLDIYRSTLDTSNDWGPAVNLGPVINTPFDEETPIINVDDELLYFSSQGHLSMGGHDIFYSLNLGDNKWHQPVNMGAPISTTDDDLFYYPLEENVSGLMSRLLPPFSSGYDIYQYNSMIFANSPRFTVKGKVDGVDSTNYTTVTIAVVNKADKDTIFHSPVSPNGTYELLLPAGDFRFLAITGTSIATISQVVLTDDSPETLQLVTATETKNDIQLVDEIVPDTIVLKSVLFAFNNFNVSHDYNAYLDQIAALLVNDTSLIVRLEGYADAVGSEEYNMALSLKRARAVVDYLSESKIEDKRIIVEGKGEADPVAINLFPDGTDCPAGRKYNRRVLLIPVNGSQNHIFISTNEVPDKFRVNSK